MPHEQTIATPYAYDHARLAGMLRAAIEAHATPEAWSWLAAKTAVLNAPGSNALAVAFAAMPRHVGKGPVQLSLEVGAELHRLRPHFGVQQWSMDRLCRVWLLLQLDAEQEDVYVRRIEALFPAAEMNELVALYSALPLLAYPEAWRGRCAEGIRSNIGPVLEAIICNNPYPSEQLPEGAWNQLVLKAFFTEKPINQIIGLDARANAALAHTLVDFARERRAAGRPVPPLLWRCVAPFIDAGMMDDVEAAFFSGDEAEQDAAALACAQSNFESAKALVHQNEAVAAAIASGTLTWHSVAQRTAAA